VLSRISEPKGHDHGENCIVRRFIIYVPWRLLLDWANEGWYEVM
jgi:hypothetical protein